MNYIVFFLILTVFAGIYILIGRRTSENIEDKQDYFLGKRSFGVFALTLTLLATQLGGGSLLGAAQEAYDKGWIVLFYPLGISLGFLFLALGFGRRMKRLNLNTIAQLFEKVYGSKRQRKFVSAVSIFTMFFILVGQAVAVQKFFVFLGIDSKICFFLFWAVIITYTSMGGLKAVVYTDIIQMIFVLFTFVLVLSFLSTNNTLPAMQDFTPVVDSQISWSSWILMPFCFVLIGEDMGQRCFSAKSESVVKKAGILASILLFLCSFFAVYFGMLAKKMNIEITGSSSVLMSCISTISPPVVTSFFACAFLMVIVSTADSLLCTIGSNITFDFPFFQKRKKVRMSQLLIFAVGLIAACFSFYFDKIVSLFILSYEFSVSVLFVPIMFALLKKKPSKQASFLSMLFGFIGFLFFRSYNTIVFSEIITLCFSTVGFFVGQKVKEKTLSKANLEVD